MQLFTTGPRSHYHKSRHPKVPLCRGFSTGALSMLSDVIRWLICPVCGEDFAFVGAAVVCRRGHSFDVAREGYMNLLVGAARSPGDSRAMVEARASFLGAGHYRRLADRVAEAAAGLIDTRDGADHAAEALIVEVGAGTGYYLDRVLQAAPGAFGLALDVSKFAVRRAARAHPCIGAVVCDVWKAIPVRSGAARIILDVFAPRNVEEFGRIVRADGALIVVAPTRRHLRELVKPLGLLTVDQHKDARVQAGLSRRFKLEHENVYEETIEPSRENAWRAAAMGPSAFHVAPDILRARAQDLPDPLAVTISARVSIYRPRS